MSSSTSSTSTSWLVVGRVGRPHGLDGSFHVIEARAVALAPGTRVQVGGEDREVARRAGTDDRPILRLAGCEDRGGAEALRGQVLLVAREHAPPLGDDEFHAEQLEGCRVHDGGRDVGVVRRLVALPSCEALEVERETGSELLVPLVRDAVRGIDPEARRIDVDLRFLDAEA